MSDRYRKSCWTDEEIALVAKEEVCLTATQQQRPANVIVALRLAFPSQTYEFIMAYTQESEKPCHVTNAAETTRG